MVIGHEEKYIGFLLTGLTCEIKLTYGKRCRTKPGGFDKISS
jgi:hypothetical protein